MAPTRPEKHSSLCVWSPGRKFAPGNELCPRTHPTQKTAASSSSSSFREEAHRYVSQSTASLLNTEKKKKEGGGVREHVHLIAKLKHSLFFFFFSSLPSEKPGLGLVLLPKQK